MTDKLSGYSTTPASNNAASPDGWPEGMTAGSVNNSDREFAARVREFYEDSQWIDYGHTIVSSTGSTIKLSTDVTAIYTAGRAIRINQDASMDGWVTASAYSAPDTSITVTGFTVAAPTQVEVGAIKDQAPLPNNLSITVASLAVTGALSSASLAVSGTLTASAISLTAASITTLDASTLTVSSILNDDATAFTSVPNMVVKTTGTGATYTLTAGATALEFILVGGGGGGGDNGNATSGGATSIIYNGVTVTAGGGVFGGSPGLLGIGGTASGGTLNINGQAGRDCFGGSAGLGYGYGGKTATAGSGYGGGGGADATGSLGGGGGACAIYRVGRVAGQDTVTYSIGAAGVGNTSTGTDGKNGAAGVLIIRY